MNNIGINNKNFINKSGKDNKNSKTSIDDKNGTNNIDNIIKYVFQKKYNKLHTQINLLKSIDANSLFIFLIRICNYIDDHTLLVTTSLLLKKIRYNDICDIKDKCLEILLTNKKIFSYELLKIILKLGTIRTKIQKNILIISKSDGNIKNMFENNYSINKFKLIMEDRIVALISAFDTERFINSIDLIDSKLRFNRNTWINIHSEEIKNRLEQLGRLFGLSFLRSNGIKLLSYNNFYELDYKKKIIYFQLFMNEVDRLIYKMKSDIKEYERLLIHTNKLYSKIYLFIHDENKGSNKNDENKDCKKDNNNLELLRENLSFIISKKISDGINDTISSYFD